MVNENYGLIGNLNMNKRGKTSYVISRLLIACLLLTIASVSCNSNQETRFQLVNPEHLAFVVGSEFDDTNRIDTYEQISTYYVDYANNLYVGDFKGIKIDEYDKYGDYVVSFGRAGQGPGEFPSAPPVFCADLRGYLYSSLIGYIDIFNSRGEFVDNIRYPEEIKDWYCLAMIADHDDNLIMSLLSQKNEFKFIKYFVKTSEFRTIHDERQRAGFYTTPFCRFIPGFDVDNKNNIFILDTIGYKVFIYSPDGKLINTFQKNLRRHKITKKDLNYTVGNHVIQRFPESYINQLKGNARYFPVLCGINIDNNQIFLWRSDMDSEFKRKIDIYDDKFRLLGTSSYYNWAFYNYVYIRNGFVYSLNIGDEDINFKKKLGALGLYQIPNKVICYKYYQ